MKNTKLSELPIEPAEYDVSHYSRIDYSSIFSLMTSYERRFINGLLRYYRPKRILEIGVESGGGTINILNAICDNESACLFSIDASSVCVHSDALCGHEAKQLYPNIDESKWRLIVDKDPSEVMKDIAADGLFDFAIIDTAHSHPVESLNFLSILPYLRDGAIVVLHDISAYAIHDATGCAPGKYFAPRILLSSVVAEKLVPRIYCENESIYPNGFINIVAFQINGDTRKYIGNIFDSLMLPWEFIPHKHLDTIRKTLSNCYSKINVQKFDLAEKLSLTWFCSGRRTFSSDVLRSVLARYISPTTVFYGAGYYMKCMLRFLSNIGVSFNSNIWDLNAEIIVSIEGNHVSLPDFKTKVSDCVAIITIEDKAVASEVCAKLESVGFRAFHGLSSLCESAALSI